jgi:hypothetical protein
MGFLTREAMICSAGSLRAAAAAFHVARHPASSDVGENETGGALVRQLGPILILNSARADRDRSGLEKY